MDVREFDRPVPDDHYPLIPNITGQKPVTVDDDVTLLIVIVAMLYALARYCRMYIATDLFGAKVRIRTAAMISLANSDTIDHSGLWVVQLAQKKKKKKKITRTIYFLAHVSMNAWQIRLQMKSILHIKSLVEHPHSHTE